MKSKSKTREHDHDLVDAFHLIRLLGHGISVLLLKIHMLSRKLTTSQRLTWLKISLSQE